MKPVGVLIISAITNRAPNTAIAATIPVLILALGSRLSPASSAAKSATATAMPASPARPPPIPVTTSALRMNVGKKFNT
ncbi:Uncharacterised protein [Mycobacterium tuberculosis]|nr:Uncharacterised protein [Mycobacterium tuberculosis]